MLQGRCHAAGGLRHLGGERRRLAQPRGSRQGSLPKVLGACMVVFKRLTGICISRPKDAQTWRVPSNAVPGVYLARLVMEDPPAFWRSDASEIQPSSKFANRALEFIHKIVLHWVSKFYIPAPPKERHLVFAFGWSQGMVLRDPFCRPLCQTQFQVLPTTNSKHSTQMRSKVTRNGTNYGIWRAPILY